MEKQISVYVDFELTPKEIEALILLYQPVFAFPAFSLYMTLYEIGKVLQTTNYKELARTIQLDIDLIIHCRKELERFNLMHTYEDDKMQCVLHAPLKPDAFIHHALFGRLYSIVCGNDAYKEVSIRYMKSSYQLTGKDITTSFDASRLSSWNEEFEEGFVSVSLTEKPNFFDVDAFFDSISLAIYPLELRTPKVRQLISEVGSLYQITYSTMKTKLFESTNFDTKRFDTRKFVALIEKEFGVAKVDENDPYNVDPISYLRYKQNHDYIAQADRNLLESLVINFGFDHRVVNVLVEYVLETNDKNLNRAYVEKIAANWKRKGITTMEDALKEIARPFSNTKKKESVKKKVFEPPVYSKDTSISEDEKVLRERLKALVGKDD